MNSRERVLQTINGKEPDRPPVYATVTPQVAEKLSARLGMEYEPPLDSLLSSRISHTKLLTALGNDCVGIASCAPADNPTTTDKNGIITNEWGMLFKTIGLYNEFYDYPLKNADSVGDIINYKFPDPHDASRYFEAVKSVSNYSENYAVVADLETSVFETSWYLTGLEKLLIDMMTEKQYVYKLLDKVLEINILTGKKLIEYGADIIWAGDDFGTQKGLLMDPSSWRRIFKPRIKLMFEEFRKINSNIKIAWHSCGSILEIIPDFIDLGLDILNPVQPRANGMKPEHLKSEYGRDLVFFGGIDVQDLLPNSSPQIIKEEVKRVASVLGRNGGYIMAPAHNIQDDTPVENILAFFEASKEL